MKPFFLIFCFAYLAMACTGVRVINTEQGENVDFTHYKTFNFYQLSAAGDTISQGFEQRMAILKDAISKELNKRGFTLSNANPDILVNIGIVVKEEVQTRQTDFRTDAPKYIGQRNYSWKSETIEVGRYRQGTATVHLVDALRNKMIWKGAVESIIPDKKSGLERAAAEGMKKLFEQFPVPVK